MTTKEVERGKVLPTFHSFVCKLYCCVFFFVQTKCARYWPEENQVKEMGKITLKCISDSVRADYTLREFVATKDGEERLIYQYHFQVISFISLFCDSCGM